MGCEYSTSLSSSRASRIRPTQVNCVQLPLYPEPLRLLLGDVAEHDHGARHRGRYMIGAAE